MSELIAREGQDNFLAHIGNAFQASKNRVAARPFGEIVAY